MNLVQRKMKPSGVDWIGDVPEGWDVTRFGYHATVKANLVDVDDYGSFPQISPENIEKNTGRLLAHGTVEDSGVISGNHLFKQGQILYSKIRPALNKVTIAPYPGLCCADMYPIETDEDARYMIYLMLADCFVKQAEMVANMRIKMPKINQDELARIHIAVPPLDEQKRIVAKLDRLCGRVDELAENIKGEIAALQEYRKSLITECVTKGLNPKAKMKPSGVDWIGDIPDKWTVMRLKDIIDIPLFYGAALTGDDYQECLPRYIRITDITDDGRLSDSEKLSLQWCDAKPYLLKDQDILLARSGATAGKSFLYCSNYGPAAFAGYLICCRLDKTLVSPRYVYYTMLSHPYDRWRETVVTQATIPNISGAKYENYKLAIPSLSEQFGVVVFLDKRCAVIDAKIAERQKQLEKLGEYRSSVIYEYVTGKREASA